MAGSAATPVNEALRSTLDEVRKELLDFGLRNPLLNYRLLKSRGLHVTRLSPAETFQMLVTEGREPSFLSAEDLERLELQLSPGTAQRQPSEKSSSSSSVTRGSAVVGTKPNSWSPYSALPTELREKELESRLLSTYYAAKSSIDEQGVNTLFLALGMLMWREPVAPEELRCAPLLLIPVELERKSASDGFTIKYTGDDVVPNFCLREFLKQSFGLKWEDPAESEDLNIDSYLATVREAITRQDRWDVDANRVALGFFSFAKFLMYRDLDPDTWTDPGALLSHAILNRLIGAGSFDGDPSLFGESEFIDDYLFSDQASHVVDADSTQALALLEARTGHNMVIQGPPGTGKSQTIVNLIAEAIATGKKVLFVSEKKAALEVVKERLDRVGLGSACLELHSNKIKKKDVIEELKRTARIQAAGVQRGGTDQAVLEQARKQLNDYCRAVNAPPGKSGETVRDLYGRLLATLNKLGNLEIPQVALPDGVDWTDIDLHRKRHRISRLKDQLQQSGIPSKNPFWGSQIRILLPTTRDNIRRSLNEAAAVARLLADCGRDLAPLFGQEVPLSRDAYIRLCASAKRIATAPSLLGINSRYSAWIEQEAKLREALTAGKNLSALTGEWRERINTSAWSSNVESLEQSLKQLEGKWWRFMSPRWREAKRQVAELVNGPMPRKDLVAIPRAILAAKGYRLHLESCGPLLRQLYGQSWQGEASDWLLVSRQLDWITSTVRGIASGELHEWCLSAGMGAVDPKTVNALIPKAESLLVESAFAKKHVIEALKLDETTELPSALDNLWGEEASRFFLNLATRVGDLDALVAYGQAADECREDGLNSIVTLANSWDHGPEHLADVFDYTRVSLLLDAAYRANPILASFDGDHHNRHVDVFRQMDSLQLQWTRHAIAGSHAAGIPKSNGGNGQIAVLWREFEKKARHLAVRQLILKAGNAVQAIKPVFMMSPLSVANFLSPGTVEFDLVVFDEASQVKPADALGAIVRGKQAIVVGDSKQLPPSSFFDTLIAQDVNTEDDDAVATSDIESILGLFCSRGAPQRMLRWHYRSQHESLIAGSNHLFYDDRLVVFPSPDQRKQSVGLIYRRIENAVYDRSKTRTNRGEARIIAEAVMKHAAEQLQRPKEQRLTLGVAALSVAQRDAILDELEILRRQNHNSEEFFATTREQFFVKNLENVQGDERDIIFISIGYGRTAEGYLAMSFGPVNRAGGERRLNVLFSRARKRCEVFTTLSSDDIDTSRNDTGGVYALKAFLHLAENGNLDIPTPSGDSPESPFEEQVLSALQSCGHMVHTQVGSAGFYLDLAVVDPSTPGRYLLGIECDGAAYHSARSTRDRDRLRQVVLESLGWKIHRIWSTAWFSKPDRELQSLLAAIEAAMNQSAFKADTSEKIISPANIVPDTAVAPSVAGDISPTPKSIATPKYKMADLRVELGSRELHLVPLEQLADWMAQVVEVESPVHWLEAARRVTSAAGIQRVGSRIQDAFQRACQSGSHRKRFVLKNSFLWNTNQQAPLIRDRSDFPSQSKKLEYVAPEEIEAAIELSIRESFGLDPEDVAVSTCRLLGFARVSEDMRVIIEKQRDHLIANERLSKRGTTLICSNEIKVDQSPVIASYAKET